MASRYRFTIADYLICTLRRSRSGVRTILLSLRPNGSDWPSARIGWRPPEPHFSSSKRVRRGRKTRAYGTDLPIGPYEDATKNKKARRES